MSLGRWARGIGRCSLEFVYPSACHWCGSLLSDLRRTESRFCAECELLLAPEIPDRCQRCSAPVGPNLDTSGGCIRCGRDPMSYRQVASLGPYEKELRSACLQCKQPGQRPLTNALAEVLCRRNQELLCRWQVDVVLPVPHHWRDRLWSDPAADAVAECVGRFLMTPVDRHILFKVRRTPKQLELSASARRKNLRSAFRVAGAVRLKGFKVLLIDDILTTGTTAQRCTQTLLKAGADGVYVAALARGVGA